MQHIIEKLNSIVGKVHVLTDDAVHDRNPGWSPASCAADLLVRPSSTEELSGVVRVAADAGLQIVAHGGLTGLVQGTASAAGNLIVSFERMNNVVRIDPVQNVMVVQAGVTVQKAHELLDEHDLMLGVDIPSRGSCTIGGIISTNAGGIRVIRYGMTRENLLGLDAVLADGTILRMSNTLMKNNAGFDLKQLFIGSEGTLGLVTQAVFKLHPKPVAEHTALVALDSADDVLVLLKQARASLGSSLLYFEVMWHEYYRDVTAHNAQQRPLPDTHKLYAIIESGQWQMNDNAADFLQQLLADSLESGLIKDAVIASSSRERAEIWQIRENTEPVQAPYERILSYDVGFELQHLDDFVEQLKISMKQFWPDKPIYVFGHLGDGNLHIIIGVTSAEHDDRQLIDNALYKVVGLFPNSTVSAEHGIGLDKRDYLHLSRDQSQIDVMKNLLAMIDPADALNPGKIV